MKKQKGRPDDAGEFKETLEKRLDAADALLRESEDRLSTVFRASPIGIGISRLADGKFIDINDAFLDIYGYTREEIIGHCSDELNLWADPIQRASVVATLREKRSVRNVEMECRRKSGEIGYLLVSAERIELAGEECFLGTFYDITKKRQIEETLRQQDIRYRAVLEDQIEVITRYLPDGTYTFVNDVYCKLFGKTRDELLGNSWQPDAYPDDIPLIKAKLKEMSAENSVVVVENRIHLATGEVRWMQFVNRGFYDDHGKLLEIQAVGRDITERKRIEEALKASEERLMLALTASKMGVWEWNIPSNSVIWSPECFAILGTDKFSGTLDSFTDQLHPEDAGRVWTAINKALSEKTIYIAEFRILRPDGEVRWLSDLGRAEYDEEGKPIRLVGTVQDITDRKKAEQELLLTKHCLETASISIYIISTDNRIVWVNDHVCKSLGYSREELCSMSTPNIDPVITTAGIAELRRKVKEHGYVIFETIHQRKDGSRIPVEINTNELEFDGKKIAICFVQDISERKRTEKELLNRQAVINSMAQELSITEEHQRLRIAEELHDQIAPKLFLTKMKIRALAVSIPREESETVIEEIEAVLDSTLENIRSLVFQLRPPILANAGLEAALKWLTQEFEENYGLIVKITDDMSYKPLKYEIRSAIFQVVRELLLNVVKHACTKNAWITIKRRNDKIDIKVEDDGCGTDLANFSYDKPKPGGFGIYNTRLKIEHLGGELLMDSSAGSGTRAYITAPLDSALTREE